MKANRQESKNRFVASHIEALNYHHDKLDRKIDTVTGQPLKQLSSSYISSVDYHRVHAVKHLKKEPNWAVKLGKLSSEVQIKLDSSPIVIWQGNSWITNYDLYRNAVKLFRKEVEQVLTKALDSIELTSKVEKARVKRIAENKSLGELFVTGDKY